MVLHLHTVMTVNAFLSITLTIEIIIITWILRDWPVFCPCDPLAIKLSQSSASIFDQDLVGLRDTLSLNCWSYWTHCTVGHSSDAPQITDKYFRSSCALFGWFSITNCIYVMKASAHIFMLSIDFTFSILTGQPAFRQ